MLKVININSRIDLTSADCAFVEQVIEYAEKLLKWERRNSISELLSEIPVFLLSPEKMPVWPFEEDEIGDNPGIEYLGFYTRITSVYFDSIPAIFICPERILLTAKNKSYQELLAVLIIHEFAHAKMDSFPEDKIDFSNEFYRWVEEPYANWFVLKYFHSYGNGYLFHSVKDCIQKEPENYKLGCIFFDADLDCRYWEEWKEIKKIGVKETKKKDWLDKMKVNPKNIKAEWEKFIKI